MKITFVVALLSVSRAYEILEGPYEPGSREYLRAQMAGSHAIHHAEHAPVYHEPIYDYPDEAYYEPVVYADPGPIYAPGSREYLRA